MSNANGVDIRHSVNLLSEVRAPGGALLALGALIGTGAFVSRLTFSSALMGAALYLAYGGARLVSVVVDGMPTTILVAATVLELGVGLASGAVLFTHRR